MTPAILRWPLALCLLSAAVALLAQRLELATGENGSLLTSSGWFGSASLAAEQAVDWLESHRLELRLLVFGLAGGVALLLARRASLWTLLLALAGGLALDPLQASFALGLVGEGAANSLELEHARRALAMTLLLAALLAACPARGAQTALPLERAHNGAALLAELLLAGAVSLGLGLLLSERWLEGQPLTNDGKAYLWQARLFAQGQLSLPGGPWTDFFPARQIYSGGLVFSKYPPGHSLVLALGLAIGAAKAWVWAGALLAPAGVWYLAGRLGFERPRLAAWVFALSPMAIGIHGLWLAHGSSLPSGLLFLCAAESALARCATGRPAAARASLAGLALGLCFLARPGTALALCLPHLGSLWARAPRSRAALFGATLLGALPALVVYLTFNQQLTGSPWLSPYELYAAERSPNDRWGLVNLGTAWPNTAFNLGRLDRWLTGSAGGLALLVVGVRASWPAARLSIALGVPLCLLGFYALLRFHGVPWAGPSYLVEGLPLMACLASAGLARVAARLAPAARPLLAPLLAGAAGWRLAVQFEQAGREYALRSRAEAAARAAPLQPALVFVPLRNEQEIKRFHLAPPLEREPFVLARDLGPRNRELQRAWRDFCAYRFDPDSGSLTPLPPPER
jgi:hypothetical protein